MAQIVKTNEWGRTDIFEIVDAVPAGFQVWNIGEHAPKGYVPLCEPMPDDRWSVNADTLKAIKHDHAREILRAAGAGGVTLKKCRKRARSSNEWVRRRCAEALPYMEQMTWN